MFSWMGDTMSLDLIDHALQYAQEVRNEKIKAEGWIIEPLFPDAVRSTFYLRVRESITSGCSKAVKIIPENWKRSVAMSILNMALHDLFNFGKKQSIITYYNELLDKTIGTH
jgi:hypothetical protein